MSVGQLGIAPISMDHTTGTRLVPGTRLVRRWPALLIILVGLFFYLDSFQGAFVYDEINFITNNPTIRQLWPPWPALLAPINVNRPLIGLTNAMNYGISGLNPWSYHALNLIIHLMAALALFGIVRRTLRAGKLAGPFGKNSNALSLVVALIWMVHPLQTQSVTYVIQRCESLMGMFYLVTLYCSIRSFSSNRAGLWYAVAIAACAGGMLSKQVMVTAPLAVLLYEVSFGGGSIRGVLVKRWPLYTGLAATWALLAVIVIAAPVNDTAGFAVKSISSWDYCKSEFAVILYYLRLAFWPYPLCLDYYGWPQARTIGQILPCAVGVGTLVLASVWAIVRRLPSGFLGVAFFLILSVTSSIMPFSDFVFEHRMYLPLAPLVTLVVIGGYSMTGYLIDRLPAVARRKRHGKRLAMAMATIIIVVLGFATARRNVDYQSDITMWSDVAAKRPDNARAHNNLGEILAGRNRIEEATVQFDQAVKLDPNFFDA